MESPGARLKKLRLEKGISLEEAHKSTKIDLNILKAIEENDLVNLSPVYIKGFMKMYCQFLNVDPKEYIQDYKEPQSKVEVARKTERESTSSPLLKGVVAKIFSLKQYFNRTTFFIAAVIIASFFLVKGLRSIKIAKPAAEPAQVKVSKPLSVNKKPKQQAQTALKPAAVSVPKVQKVQEPALTTTAATGIRLGIHAKDDCWIQLKIDGKTVFQSVLKKGRFEVWIAKEKMELSLGNVGNTEIELNGKVISPLGRKGQVLKNILITKDGLKVQR